MTASFKSPGQHAGRALFPTSFAISNGEGSDCLPPLQSTFNNKESGERIYIYIFPIQSSEFIKSLNFGSNLKKLQQEKNFNQFSITRNRRSVS